MKKNLSTENSDSDRSANDYGERNEKVEYTICPHCGGRYVYKSWLVPDGLDDVTWDFNEWCENPDCPSNKIDTNTEFGTVKNEKNVKSSRIL